MSSIRREPKPALDGSVALPAGLPTPLTEKLVWRGTEQRGPEQRGAEQRGPKGTREVLRGPVGPAAS